jgi:hypothetical protein
LINGRRVKSEAVERVAFCSQGQGQGLLESVLGPARLRIRRVVPGAAPDAQCVRGAKACAGLDGRAGLCRKMDRGWKPKGPDSDWVARRGDGRALTRRLGWIGEGTLGLGEEEGLGSESLAVSRRLEFPGKRSARVG